jgi:hypothetical protein
MVPPFMRDDIRLCYDEVKTAGFTENPVQKVPLIICGNEGRVHMVDAPVAYQGGQQLAGGGANNNALPMGFQDRPLQDQMQVLYSQNAILGRGFSELRAAVENNAATNLRNYNQLNRNINRIAMEPARCVAGQAAAAGNNNQGAANHPQAANQPPVAGAAAAAVGPVNNYVGMASLSPTPRSLYDLWVEYQTGIGGRKPARDFTARERGLDKYRYYRRKLVWDIVSNLVNAGIIARVAIDRIYNHYGANRSVTRIINDIMRDKRNGGLPQVLRV